MNDKFAIATTLRDLPPTSLATADQLLVEESLQRTLPFADFLQLGEFVERTHNSRRKALTQLAKCNFNSSDDLVAFVDSHRSIRGNADTSIYLLYFVGAYDAAGQLLTEHVQRETPDLFHRIWALRNEPSILAALHELDKIVNEFPNTSHFAVRCHSRLKSIGAVAAKVLATAIRRPLPTLRTRLTISTIEPPYDLIGCRIVVRANDANEFALRYAEVVTKFSNLGTEPQEHRRYSLNRIHGASIIGTLAITGLNVPFQVQIWNEAAARYESMSHGNYKLHRHLQPILPEWRSLCEQDVTPLEYAQLIIKRLNIDS